MFGKQGCGFLKVQSHFHMSGLYCKKIKVKKDFFLGVIISDDGNLIGAELLLFKQDA